MDGQTDGRTDGRTGGRVDEGTCGRAFERFALLPKKVLMIENSQITDRIGRIGSE